MASEPVFNIRYSQNSRHQQELSRILNRVKPLEPCTIWSLLPQWAQILTNYWAEESVQVQNRRVWCCSLNWRECWKVSDPYGWQLRCGDTWELWLIGRWWIGCEHPWESLQIWRCGDLPPCTQKVCRHLCYCRPWWSRIALWYWGALIVSRFRFNDRFFERQLHAGRRRRSSSEQEPVWSIFPRLSRHVRRLLIQLSWGWWGVWEGDSQWTWNCFVTWIKYQRL